jgi:hypothetical protein
VITAKPTAGLRAAPVCPPHKVMLESNERPTVKQLSHPSGEGEVRGFLTIKITEINRKVQIVSEKKAPMSEVIGSNFAITLSSLSMFICHMHT